MEKIESADVGTYRINCFTSKCFFFTFAINLILLHFLIGHFGNIYWTWFFYWTFNWRLCLKSMLFCVIIANLTRFLNWHVSGAFFTLGGFQLPFYVMGLVMLLTLPFSIYFLPKTNQSIIKRNLGTKVFVIFKIPAVFIICLVVAVSSSAWSVLEPTLVIHMQQVSYVY